MKMILETRNNMTDQWQQERAHFPLLQQKTYLAAASTGLVPDYIYRAMRDYQDSRYLVGGNLSWNGMTTLEMMDWSKQMLADMLGAKKENIAFGDNSSRMLNLFTGGLDWQKGDQVLLSADCFISDRFAWQARQEIEPVFLPTRKGMPLPEDIAAAITPRTRAVSLCCAESSTGFQADLARIGALCREKGIWLCVDAVQSAGILPLCADRRTGVLVYAVLSWFTKHFGNAGTASLGCLMSMVGYGIRFLLHDMNVWVMTVGWTFSTVGVGLVGATIVLNIFDAKVYGEWKTGVNNEAILMSGFSVSYKVGMALGGPIAGYLLMLVPHVPKAAEQAESVKQLFFVENTLLPCVGFLIALVFSLMIRKYEKMLPQMRAEIEARKKEA